VRFGCDDAGVEDFGRREENRVEDRIYLERCTTTRGAVFVSVDPVSTSWLSLKMVLDKEVESGAIQAGLA
jgi:hypothetical protein